MSDWDDGDYYDISFAVERGRRYHAKMCAFYDWCHHLATAATALTGTASFFVLLAKGLGIATWLSAVVAAAASLDSVFRFERKARLHERLSRKFTALSANIVEWDASPENLKQAKVARLRIEADEPPVRRLIDLQAQNEECRARGIAEEKLIPLSKAQRTFGYVFTFGMARLEQWKREQQKREEASEQEAT